MSVAADIVKLIEDLIKAKLSGSYGDVVDKRLEQLGINHSTTLRELREQHAYWSDVAASEEGGEELMRAF